MVAGIDVADHERGKLIFLPRRAPVEKHEATGLQKMVNFLQHALIVGKVFNDSHEDDGIEFLFRVVIVEVGEDDVELVAEIGKLPFEIRLGDLGIGDAGKAQAGSQRVTGDGAPTGADLKRGLTWTELALLDGPVELPLERLRERLIVMGINPLAVGG